VARHAGVGTGTVYRRFPDKAQLVDALFESRFAEMLAVAEAALADDDPWDGFVRYLVGGAEMQIRDRALSELLLGEFQSSDRLRRARERILPSLTRLLERAHDAGVVRRDLAVTDIPLLQTMLKAVAELVGPDHWRRVVPIVLAGLRDDTEPLPVAALSVESLEAAMLSRAGSAPRDGRGRPRASGRSGGARRPDPSGSTSPRAGRRR
jgi:AcrR family transcriptional regulator